MSHRAPWLTVVLVAVVAAACTGAPAGPRPTLPRPSYAPVVVPDANDTKGRPGRDATPRGDEMNSYEWLVAYCRAQDRVFSLQFAIAWLGRFQLGRDLSSIRRSLRMLETRVERAKSALERFPPRVARPLITVQRTFVRALDRTTDTLQSIARTGNPRYLAGLRTQARTLDRSWSRMVRLHERMYVDHELKCR